MSQDAPRSGHTVVNSHFHQYLLAFHVLVAVLLLAELVGLTVLSRPRPGVRRDSSLGLLRRLVRLATVQLALLLLSGIALMAVSGGLRGAPGWLRGSLVLFVAAGAALGILRRTVRAAAAASPDPQRVMLNRIRYATWALDGLVAAIASLMVIK